jgi:hypothetical protein
MAIADTARRPDLVGGRKGGAGATRRGEVGGDGASQGRQARGRGRHGNEEASAAPGG